MSGPPETTATSLRNAVKAEALRVGFDLVGITPATVPGGLASFHDWLRRGYDGEMAWLSRREEAYEHPRHVLAGVRSVIMLALNYRTDEPAPPCPGAGLVSRYAWSDADYHAVARERLKLLADFLHAKAPGSRTRSVIDSAPMLERDFARAAGLGWFGKNTMLINKRQGSWIFLAGLLTDLELEPDAPHETSHCGTCTRCLDACPTDAFPQPYVLDSRKCIAYLTIELKGPIPHELRAGMGDWLFGCDICQDVCPWNHKSPRKNDPAFVPRGDLNPADLDRLLRLDEVGFRTAFGESALSRPGRAGLLRNAAIVLGNQRDRRAVPALERALNESEPVVRGAAAWALGQIGDASALAALKSRLCVEDNATVQTEINQALAAE
ncbi:MAG TPA: tRNA epoxyqueuosine(34) reductase QueG [Planctomycetaceae bacterium]|nr:tRNA epoxyqueuosine(34) reductase QueG [Planctomycetaceae bacterium]